MNLIKIKIGVAVFKSRISPRFDCAPQMLILAEDSIGFTERRIIDTEGWTALERIKKLNELQVKILICGGIDEHSRQLINAGNIKIYSWITGEYEDALSCYLAGKLASGNMMGPGGTSRGKWRFRQGRMDANRGGVRCRTKTEKGRGGSRGKRNFRDLDNKNQPEKYGD